MHKICGLAIAAMLMAGYAPVSAQQAGTQPGTEPGSGYNAPANQPGTYQGQQPGTTGQQQQPGSAGTMPQPGNTGAMQPPAAGTAQNEMWQHQVTGKVSRVDRKTGLVTLRTNPNTMLVLSFPRDSLRDIKVGDTVTASMSVAKAGSEHTAHAYDVPKGSAAERLSGQHQVSGRITTIDHRSGLLTVRSENKTTMRLQFPPNSIQNLNKGDQITVNLGFTKSNMQQGSVR